MGPDATIFIFLMFSFKPALSLSSFTLMQRLFSSSLLSAMRVVSSTYLRLLMFLPPILIPVCNSSNLAFLMMYAVHRLNEHGDNRQPCHIPFSILSPSVVLYRALTVASWPAYRFLRRQVRQPGIPISLRAFTVYYDLQSQRLLVNGVVNETEVDVFLKFPSFLYDPANVGNLMLVICWSLVPLPFLNPSWTSASSSFT